LFNDTQAEKHSFLLFSNVYTLLIFTVIYFCAATEANNPVNLILSLHCQSFNLVVLLPLLQSMVSHPLL